jgi:hypothetical protein
VPGGIGADLSHPDGGKEGLSASAAGFDGRGGGSLIILLEALKMRIIINIWNTDLCLYLLPSLFMCADHGDPWWDISRIHFCFIQSEIIVLFD